VQLARNTDPRFRVTSAKRSTTEQVALYQRWLRGDPGVFTPAYPGTSQHEKGWALDMARRNVHPKEDEALAALGNWWRSQGGVWGGSSDPVHFEAPKAWTGRK
jgi:LAS superfamily LD-carboxypeptidase LdcB